MSNLKHIGPNNANQLANLWVETFKQAYEGVHTPENILAYCEENFTPAQAKAALSDPKTECVIAYKGTNPVGFSLLSHHDCPVILDGPSSELKQIYILANQYGTGLGRTLYESAIKSLRDQNREWVWLCVSDINHRAKAFYQKLEFTAIGTGPIFEVGTDRLSSTIMAKSI